MSGAHQDPAFVIAEETHRVLSGWSASDASAGTAFHGSGDLVQSCALASALLQRRLARAGIQSSIVTGEYDLGDWDLAGQENHAWLELGDGRWCDIAAEQFGTVPDMHPYDDDLDTWVLLGLPDGVEWKGYEPRARHASLATLSEGWTLNRQVPSVDLLDAIEGLF